MRDIFYHSSDCCSWNSLTEKTVLHLRSNSYFLPLIIARNVYLKRYDRQLFPGDRNVLFLSTSVEISFIKHVFSFLSSMQKFSPLNFPRIRGRR